MPFQEKQIAQIRPSGTAAVPAYSPAVGVTGIIKSVTVCNVNAGTIKFSIFLDDGGATFNESTALYFEAELLKGQTFEREVFWPMNNPAGTLGGCQRRAEPAVMAARCLPRQHPAPWISVHPPPHRGVGSHASPQLG